MSRKGNCWDNAVTEAFFGSLKKELIEKQLYKAREPATAVVGSLLFGVALTDSTSHVVAALTMAGTALLASYLQARRLLQSDPARAFRVGWTSGRRAQPTKQPSVNSAVGPTCL